MSAEIVRQATLQELETVIERGVQTFVEVGLALMEVRDRKLYEEAGYVNFEMYCFGRWGFKRRHGYRLIEAAQTAKALNDGDVVSHGTQIPESIRINERQARELAPLVKEDPEAAREVWREVNEQNQHVTASKIREAVTQHFADSTEPDEPGWEPDPRVDGLKSAIKTLERCQRERNDRYAVAFRNAAGQLRQILREMEADEAI